MFGFEIETPKGTASSEAGASNEDYEESETTERIAPGDFLCVVSKVAKNNCNRQSLSVKKDQRCSELPLCT